VQTDRNPGAPSLRDCIRGDIFAWARLWCPAAIIGERVSWKESVKLAWNQAGLRATLLFRISHALWQRHIPLLPGMIARLNLSRHGLDIPPSVQIGPGLYIPHPVGTVVMAHRIGARVSLISGITIGMRRTLIFPTVGDDVFVGAGARILGDITIGSGANIGANAVVLINVPEGATAVGIPAKVRVASEVGDRQA